ncbi:Protein of unknown function [Gryllus bimaculatus]|nr:Protein of unknown function [Gryllus bimaculatus]
MVKESQAPRRRRRCADFVAWERIATTKNPSPRVNTAASSVCSSSPGGTVSATGAWRGREGEGADGRRRGVAVQCGRLRLGHGLPSPPPRASGLPACLPGCRAAPAGRSMRLTPPPPPHGAREGPKRRQRTPAAPRLRRVFTKKKKYQLKSNQNDGAG